MEESNKATPVTQPEPEPQQPGEGEGRRNTLRNIGIAAAVLLVIAIIVAAIWGLATHPAATAVVRDIFIIVLALVTIAIGLLLAILIFQIQSLTALLRDEIKPILHSTKETVGTVRGTTTFVSDAVAKPMIEAASLTAGFLGSLRALTRTGRQTRRRKRVRGDKP